MTILCDVCRKPMTIHGFTLACERGYSGEYEGHWLTIFPAIVNMRHNCKQQHACSVKCLQKLIAARVPKMKPGKVN